MEKERMIKTKDLKIDEKEQIFNPKTKKFKNKKTKKLELENVESKNINNNEEISHNNQIQPTNNNEVIVKSEKIKISSLLKTLDKKIKIYYYFLLIVTFGLIKKTIRNRIESNTENVIKTSSDIPFNIAIFMNALGGKNNILAVSATISSVKIELKNIEAVDKEKIKEIAQRGILISQNSLTIIFGNFSEKLKEIIEKEIK